VAVRDSSGLYLEILESAPTAGLPLEFEIFDGAAPSTHLATIEHAREGSFSSLLSEAGAGRFKLLRSDPKATAAILAEGNVVRCRTGGIDRFAYLIEEPAETLTAEREAAGEDVTIAGRGLLSYLERGAVYPAVWPPAAVAYHNRAYATGTGLSLACDRPAGVVAGEVEIAVVTVVGGSAKTIHPPKGWQFVSRINNGTALGIAIYRRATAAGEPAMYTWTFTTSTDASIVIAAMRSATPDHRQYALASATGSGTAISNPSVSVGLVDGILLTIAATTANTTITPPAGVTELIDLNTTGRTIEMGYQHGPALGDTGDLTSTAAAGGSWIGASLFIPSSGSNDITFTAATPGAILATLIDAAQARGGIPHLTYDFTATADSAGAPWDDTGQLTFHVGMSLLDVWRVLTALGMEGDMTPAFKLRAYVDRSRQFESSVIFRKGKHLRADVVRTTHGSGRRTRSLVEGAGGRLVEAADASAETDGRIGRREGYLAMTSSDDPTDLSAAGNATIEISTLEARSLDLPVHHGASAAGEYEPWVDYREGDYIGLDAAGTGETSAERIVGISVKQEGADYGVELVLNALALTTQTRLRRMLDALAGRGNGSGGGAASFGLGGGGGSAGGGAGSGLVAATAGDVTGYLIDKISATAGLTKTLGGVAGSRVAQLGTDDTYLELVSRKGAASGYASLDAGAKVPTAQLGGAGADSTKFLRGDQSWATPGGGGGSSRRAFDDPCDSASLPTGASSTGQLTYDATRLRRELGGTSASTYVVPVKALNGPLIVEVVYENLNALAGGTFTCRAIRETDSASIVSVDSQSDANEVTYIGGTARSASGTGASSAESAVSLRRMVIQVSEQKRVMAGVFNGAQTGTGLINSGVSTSTGAEFTYAGTLNAGDNIKFQLETSGTRKVAIYLVRVWRGAVAP
jgi:hypothetical protein